MASPFIKKTKRGSARHIRTADDDDDELAVTPGTPSSSRVAGGEVDTSDSPASAIAAARAKSKPKKKKLDQRLSFGGDDDETSPSTFVPKKSALSRALQIPIPASPAGSSSAYAAPLPSTPSSSYSKESLSQLKAATPSTPAFSSTAVAVDDDDVDSNGWSRATREKYGNMVVDDSTLSIPTAAQVSAAKARRSKLRANPHAEDFISLDGQAGTVQIRGDYDTDRNGPHPDSRLVREEDELGEGDDEHAEFTGANERIPLGKKANRDAARRLKAGIIEMIEDAELDEGSDDESKEWEEAQIKRASQWERATKVEKNVKRPYKAATIPEPIPLPTLAGASSRLATALSVLTVSHAEHTTRLENVGAEQAGLDAQETMLRKEVERVEKKWEWATEFRGWVEEIGKFLEVKYPELEKIEKENVDLIRERQLTLSRRRLDDDSDDLALCLGVPYNDPASNKSSIGDPSAPSDAEERNARRANRASRVSQPGLNPTEEGYLSDSALPDADTADYMAARSELRDRLQTVLGDVGAEDFRDPEVGLAKRFALWQQEYGEDYQGAYGGIAMVQAWEFWARWEMGDWDPLDSNKTLDSFSFYPALYAFSRPRPRQSGSISDDEDDEPSLGPDGDLVAAIIASPVVPRLTKIFEAALAYDCYSTKATRKAIDLVEQVEEFVPREKPKFKALVASILSSFTKLITSLSDLTQAASRGAPPPAFNPLSFHSRARFLARINKLIRNALLFRPYAPEAAAEIVTRLVDVGRIAAERAWEEEMGGKMWAENLLGVIPAGVLSQEMTARLRSGPPRGW